MTSRPLKLPFVSEELLRHLGDIFPIKLSKDFTQRDYDRQVGQQEIIAHLNKLFDDQQSG
jgi:hypothetical protein